MNGIKQIPIEQIKNRFVEISKFENIEADILLAHYGEYTDSKINAFLKIIEDTVLEEGSKRQIMRRLCSLLVEALQNTFNHSAKDSKGKSHSFLVLESNENSFFLTTGNLISAEDIVPVEQKIAGINKLNENELRKLYIETLCNDNFNKKGGAGLGFLTMAKKVKGKLNFQIIDINQKLAYFILKLEVAKA